MYLERRSLGVLPPATVAEWPDVAQLVAQLPAGVLAYDGNITLAVQELQRRQAAAIVAGDDVARSEAVADYIALLALPWKDQSVVAWRLLGETLTPLISAADQARLGIDLSGAAPRGPLTAEPVAIAVARAYSAPAPAPVVVEDDFVRQVTVDGVRISVDVDPATGAVIDYRGQVWFDRPRSTFTTRQYVPPGADPSLEPLASSTEATALAHQLGKPVPYYDSIGRIFWADPPAFGGVDLFGQPIELERIRNCDVSQLAGGVVYRNGVPFWNVAGSILQLLEACGLVGDNGEVLGEPPSPGGYVTPDRQPWVPPPPTSPAPGTAMDVVTTGEQRPQFDPDTVAGAAESPRVEFHPSPWLLLGLGVLGYFGVIKGSKRRR